MLAPDISEPRNLLLEFRRYKADTGLSAVVIVDFATLPPALDKASVSGGINRSGLSPLRGLGDITREQFLDMSNIYHRVPGLEYITVTGLGARYPTHVLPDRPCCGHLNNLAVLAHAEGLDVYGLLLKEQAEAIMDLDRLLKPILTALG
ncbi:MAG: hypothetical protein KAU50_00880 [Candidatus Marinimicrobia bacterium]|nr:hypothetical protein [Candidatus Neomarinimicrobiota bacterium]